MTALASSTKSHLLRGLGLASASVCAALTIGCGMGLENPASSPVAALTGVVHGGQSPIQGTTVNLYVTTTTATGYGQAATLIGTSLTDVNGSFTIAPSATPATCPTGQQAYITAAGGYPSGSPALANNSSLLMAALGDCANVSASTHVVINEITTVASAYALSGFMTTSPTTAGSLFQANVSAPAANRASSGSLTQASGLAHAFLNAAALANTFYGTANALTPNINAAGTTVNGVVPAVEINTLGDILQTCVNGVTGNTSCGSLFSFTPSISGAAPTNTLQSMINLARNPYPSTAAMTPASGLFSLVSASPAFQPALTAQPPDWSLAIVYTNATAFSAQYFIAMDANDTVYAGTSATTVSNIAGLNAYGLTTPAFAASTPGTGTRQIAPDALGNIWVTSNKTTVYKYSASAGGASTTLVTTTGADYAGVAVDTSNNVWLGNSVATTPNLTEFAFSAGTYTANYTATAPGGFQPSSIAIDAKQNIWLADYFTNNSLAAVLPNLTPAATPSYTTSGTVITPVSATFASSALKPLGLVLDAGGNAWYGITSTEPSTTVLSNNPTSTGIEEVIPTFTSSVITSLTPQSLIANATLNDYASGIPGIDGAGTIFIPDNFSSTAQTALGVHAYATVSVTSSLTGGQVLTPPSGYLGCYLATATTTACGPVSTNTYITAAYSPREISIDSTGSVWAGVTTGGFTQFIGLAEPSWPLLQSGKPGLAPGLTTAAPLP